MPTAVARRREATTQRILHAAADVVAEHGLEGLSIQRIAAAADFTPGALYRYFASRDEIVAALTMQAIEQFATALGEALDTHAAAAPLRRVVCVTHTYRRLASTHPERFALVSLLLAESRTMIPDAGQAEQAAEALVAALAPFQHALAEASDQLILEPGNPWHRAVILLTAMHGQLQLRKQARRAPDLLDLDTLAHATVRALLIGWGASPDDADDALDGTHLHLSEAAT